VAVLPPQAAHYFFHLKTLLFFKGQMKKIKSCPNPKHSNKKPLHSNRHHRSAYARKKTGEAI
jgi:hypothetical protein